MREGEHLQKPMFTASGIEDAIGPNDLDGFSEELKEQLAYVVGRVKTSKQNVSFFIKRNYSSCEYPA